LHDYNTVTMAEPVKNAYCISCGEDVPVRMVSIGIEGEELLQCEHCLSFLGTVTQPQTLSSPAIPPPVGLPTGAKSDDFRPDETTGGSAIMPEMPMSDLTPADADGGLSTEEPEPPTQADRSGGPPLDTVITVEDTALISTILNDMLVAEGLTEKVISCKNGYEFLGRYVRARKNNVDVGLVVMDVKMPILNGISAAVAMRAHETAQALPGVPILYFTSKRCDEVFRKALIHTAPAMYINKGTSVSPEHLQDRIRKVINQLLREEW
jgi:CheY-like chemotaxis protein